MKESLWGYWLIMMGIAIITLMMLLQSYVTTDQEDYYLLKEVTQAALYDSIDYTYYNKYGELKINREVFIELFERRFANSVKSNKTYKTDFYEIYESPPKVSVRVTTETGSFSISNEITNLDVVNDIDAILEFNGENVITKDYYSLTYAACNDSSSKDAMGYCTYRNEFNLNADFFKESASAYLSAKYPDLSPVDPEHFELVDITYIGVMSTKDDFNKYFTTYEENYRTAYDATGREERISDNTIETNHYAKEIKDVVILANNSEQFGWSLKYKCNDPTVPFTLANGTRITDSCLIGIKYQVKYRYT